MRMCFFGERSSWDRSFSFGMFGNYLKEGIIVMYGKPIDSIGFVANHDPELAAMMNRELLRQQDGLELIASENFASTAVIAAMGSILTNKYAEVRN